jgi:hypothetical protein
MQQTTYMYGCYEQLERENIAGEAEKVVTVLLRTFEGAVQVFTGFHNQLWNIFMGGRGGRGYASWSWLPVLTTNQSLGEIG